MISSCWVRVGVAVSTVVVDSETESKNTLGDDVLRENGGKWERQLKKLKLVTME